MDEVDQKLMVLLWHYLPKDSEHSDRRKTGIGTKTQLGLTRSVADVMGVDRLQEQNRELLEALRNLATAAEWRDNTMGDPCRLIECRALLESRAKEARAAIAKVDKEGK